jgi:hypothetical protein
VAFPDQQFHGLFSEHALIAARSAVSCSRYGPGPSAHLLARRRAVPRGPLFRLGGMSALPPEVERRRGLVERGVDRTVVTTASPRLEKPNELRKERFLFQLVKHVSTLDLGRRQAPCFLVAFVTASVFYKFGSFALECAAFLATWFVLDAAWQFATVALGANRDEARGYTSP